MVKFIFSFSISYSINVKFNLVIVTFKTEATLSTITFVNEANTFVFFRKILGSIAILNFLLVYQ